MNRLIDIQFDGQEAIEKCEKKDYCAMFWLIVFVYYFAIINIIITII